MKAEGFIRTPFSTSGALRFHSQHSFSCTTATVLYTCDTQMISSSWGVDGVFLLCFLFFNLQDVAHEFSENRFL